MKKKVLIATGLVGLALLLAGCAGLFTQDGGCPGCNSVVPGVPGDPHAVRNLDPRILGEGAIEGDYVEGQIVIGYTEEKALTGALKVLGTGASVLDTQKIGEIWVALVQLPSGMSVEEAIGRIMLAVAGKLGEEYIDFPETKDPTTRQPLAQRSVERLEGIVFVEPNYIRELIDPIPGTPNPWIKSIQPQVYDPNADLRPYQWGLDAVNAEDAWPHVTGNGITVAVIDTGVDGTHPDLAGQTVDGYDPVTAIVIPAGTDCDTVGHGTHVAGIIAAKNDGKGVVGLAYDAKVMPIVIFQPDYIGDYFVADGIMWAVDHGAQVLSNSWGGGAYSQTLKAAFDYALANSVVVVAAAGNDAEAFWTYPAAYPGLIAVGSSNPHNEKADHSNLGGWLSCVAPGEGVLSCVPTWYTQDGTGLPLLYDYWAGTSMATPHVSALAAMIKELHSTPYQVKRIIEQTALDIEAPGFDTKSGYGLIQADQAVVAPVPPDGAALRIHVVTESSPALWGEYWPTVMMDVILRRNGVDIYRGQTDLEGWWDLGYPTGDYWPGWGLGFFPSIDPGTYQILVGGDDCTPWWGDYRTANRVTGKATVTVGPGGTQTVDVEVNTTLKVTMEYTNGVPGSGGTIDIDLGIYEPGVDDWTFAWWPGLWGNWSPDAYNTPTGTEWYELIVPHYDDDEYYFAVYCWSGSADVTVTIEQNGVTEVYGPFTVDDTGFFYPASDWPGWWDWTWGAWVF